MKKFYVVIFQKYTFFIDYDAEINSRYFKIKIKILTFILNDIFSLKKFYVGTKSNKEK